MKLKLQNGKKITILTESEKAEEEKDQEFWANVFLSENAGGIND